MNRFPIPILAAGLLAVAAPSSAQSDAPPAPEPPEPPTREVRVIVAPAPEAPRPVTFGFVLDPETPPRVVRVLPRTPVDAAGVEPGDVLVRIAGETATIDGIRRTARATAPGDTVEVVIRRNGEERTLRVVPDANARVVVVDPDSIRERARFLVEKAREGIYHWSPESLAFDVDSLVRLRIDTLDFDGEWAMPNALRELGRGLSMFPMPIVGHRLGLRITEMNEGLSSYFSGVDEGILVLEVDPGSPAAAAGVEAGDVIVEMNGRPVWNVGSFHAAREAGETRMTVVRRGDRVELRIAGRGPGADTRPEPSPGE